MDSSQRKNITLALVMVGLMLFSFSIFILNEVGNDPIEVSEDVNDEQPVRSDFTTAPEWMEVDYDITYLSSTLVTVSASFSIREVKIPGYNQTPVDEVRNISAGNANAPIITALKSHIWDEIKETYENLYQESTVYESQVIIDTADIDISYIDTAQYSPPIKATSQFQVKLGESSFLTKEEIDYYNIQYLESLISGSLLLGARFDSNVFYFSHDGHNTTYTIDRSFQMAGVDDESHEVTIGATIPADVLAGSQVSLNLQADEIIITIINAQGLARLSVASTMSYKAVVDYGFNAQQWNTTVSLDLVSLNDLNIGRSYVQVNVIKMENIETGLPENMHELEYLSADGIRLFYENSILHIDKIMAYLNKSIDKFEKDVQDTLKSETKPEIEMKWDLSTITSISPKYYLSNPPPGYAILGKERPIVASLQGTNNITPKLYDSLSADGMTGFLNGGATFTFDLNMGISNEIDVMLKAPPYLRLHGRNVYGTDGSRSVYHFPPGFNDEVKIISTLSPQIDRYKALGYVTADLNDVNIESTSDADLNIDFKLEGEFYQMDSSNTFLKEYLPEGVEMAYITSDVVRLAIVEGLLDKDELIDRMTTIIEENLTEFSQEPLTLTSELDEDTVDFDGNVYDMDGSTAITFRIMGDTRYSFSSSGSTNSYAGAASVYQKDVSLKLRGLDSWDVTWKVTMPDGLGWSSKPQAVDVEGTISELTAGKNGGRDYFEVTLYDGAKCNVILPMDVTLNYLAGQFCWLIIIILIVLLVVIGLIVGLIIKARSSKKKKKKEMEEANRREEEERAFDRGYNPDGSRRQGRY